MKWTDDKITYLKDNYDKYSMNDLLEYFGCSFRALETKMSRLKLSQSSFKKETIKCLCCQKEFIDRKRNRRKFCSKSCSAKILNKTKILSEESKKSKADKLRNNINIINNLQKGRKGRLEGSKNKIKKVIISTCIDCDELIEDVHIRKYHKKCWLKHSGGRKLNSTRNTRCIYNNISLDSGAEKTFAELCDSKNIKWIKNTDIYFNYTGIDNKTHKYYPDFYLPDYETWIEIKGKYYENKDINSLEKYKVIKTNFYVIYSDNIYIPNMGVGAAGSGHSSV